ncbi:aminotransferase class I/II-fold pyridoxal phosphate-dependent enzyme [[Eubacterium] cellulosolvens]
MAIECAGCTDTIEYAIRDVVVMAKKYDNVLYLNIGDPNKFDFTTPQHMIDAVTSAMTKNYNGYAPSEGILEAREAIVKDASKKNITCTVDDVVITTGVSEAIELALAALINPGDNFLTPNPGYPLYTALVSKLSAELNPYELSETNGWQPDIDSIEKAINERTKAIIVINPNNPTGSVCDNDTLHQILKLAKENEIVVLADEIYDKLVFYQEHTALASIAGDAPVITFNGISKSYLVPGWRIGWMIFHNPNDVMTCYIEAINKLVRARLCANHPMQFGIKPALLGPQDHLKEFLDKLRRRGRFTEQRMNEIPGIKCNPITGAFYAFPTIDLNKFNFKTDKDFIISLLKEEQVLCVHGSGFGRPNAFRIVFLPPMVTLEEAYNRIESFCKKHYVD